MTHKRKLGYRFESDNPDSMRNDVEVLYRKAVTIPVNVKIEAEQRVLSYDNVKDILVNASRISLLDCICRTKRHNCDKPVRICIGVNGKADQILDSVEDDEEGWPGVLNPQEIGVDEALSVLMKSHEAGLVHMALTRHKDTRPEDIDYVCSCCTCCCSPLGAIVRYGMAPHLLTSDKIAVTDTQACNDCGICEDRCQFGAREMVNGSLAFNQDLCFGCSLCTSTCPTNAITLISK